MKNKILPVFISFAGCTSRCVYCNQHKITGVAPADILTSAKEQIKTNLSYDVEWNELAYFGGSFSCLPKDIRYSLYRLAEESGMDRLRFSTSPDCISDEIIDEALANNVKVIELGVQSLDDSVLKANRRPYDSDECIEAVRLLKERVETVGIQLMTGLYKEDFSSFVETVEKAVLLNADYARIYPCVVFPETELSDLYTSGEYAPLELSEAVARCAYGYIMLTASGCNVIRVGLHDSDSVRDSAMAGAYHPAMGDMAKTVALQTFFEMGHVLQIDQKYLNIAYGYGCILKKMHRKQVEICAGVTPDFKLICEKIKESLGEDYKRKLQTQTNRNAKGLVDKTNV
ncbi:MAG: hypothetical protein C0603_07590 [Denitrovibrio sp.]|nr:MAG: hypothetical protein C0603_07590 [Denitrovibrio sp.]